MDGGTAKDNAHTGGAGVDLCYHLGFFVGGATDYEDDYILRFVPCVPTALEEWVLQLLQTTFDEVLECHLQPRRMLGINVFDALESLESVPGAREERG